MIQKLLIANRGEIARRIIRTCKRLNIATVAVYSDADMKALHRLEADESVYIGPSPVAQSYLQMERIVQAALDTGCDAVHPGYGLLSENAAFAQKCRTTGLLYIGPPTHAIAQMGSKTVARSIVKQAGIPIVPGSNGAVENLTEALRLANSIGYPVMLKASHGGGGIGMQIVNSDEELEKAFTSNQARAKAYFGNGEMFIEEQIHEPRHIEIQVFFDSHGNGVHLFERECSVQRRHQKVVEEALSPFVNDDLRARMGQSAVQAASAIGYQNAGTLEFLVDKNGDYYFLEMNTRLQVEHPVTECITGLDLVELQIRVAVGEPLPFDQQTLCPQGHAIECRIYAEDPETLLPSPGTITQFVLPEGEGIRNDVAVRSGSHVTPYYDPMIGKLIAFGETRDIALNRLQNALEHYQVEGIKTNIPLLKRIVQSDAFINGETTTALIAQLCK